MKKTIKIQVLEKNLGFMVKQVAFAPEGEERERICASIEESSGYKVFRRRIAEPHNHHEHEYSHRRHR